MLVHVGDDLVYTEGVSANYFEVMGLRPVLGRADREAKAVSVGRDQGNLAERDPGDPCVRRASHVC